MGVTEINKVQKTAQPFLKWVGGKGRLLSQLAEHYPAAYERFFEPFVGGGAVFFSINPKTAHINDTNEVLINAYINIRDNVGRVISELKVIQQEFYVLETLEEKSEYYYYMREKFNSLATNDFEKTVLLIFLNKTCFNGVYRENSKGGFNVPFGKYVRPTICDEKNLLNVSRALRHAKITATSFEKAVQEAKAGDFIYFDPPYHPLNATSNFTSYHASGFTAKDQEKLRDVFKELADKGCKVMLSNSDTPFIKELYKDFNIHTVYAGRAVNSVGHKRGKITEVVVTSY